MAHLIHRKKTAKGRTYSTWLWRSTRRNPEDWTQVQSFDVELGDRVAGMRTRTLVALGEIPAADLVTAWVRSYFKSWVKRGTIGAFTGIKDHAKPIAWWVSFPARPGAGGKVKVVMRSRRDAPYDMRRYRSTIVLAGDTANSIWRALTDDPILRLARARWFEGEGEIRIAQCQDKLVELRRDLKRGDLSQRDYDADERSAQLRLQGWEEMVYKVRAGWDEQEKAIRDALPRTTRDRLMSQVIAKAEKLQSDPKQLNTWRAEHWIDNTLHYVI